MQSCSDDIVQAAEVTERHLAQIVFFFFLSFGKVRKETVWQ